MKRRKMISKGVSLAIVLAMLSTSNVAWAEEFSSGTAEVAEVTEFTPYEEVFGTGEAEIEVDESVSTEMEQEEAPIVEESEDISTEVATASISITGSGSDTDPYEVRGLTDGTNTFSLNKRKDYPGRKICFNLILDRPAAIYLDGYWQYYEDVIELKTLPKGTQSVATETVQLKFTNANTNNLSKDTAIDITGGYTGNDWCPLPTNGNRRYYKFTLAERSVTTLKSLPPVEGAVAQSNMTFNVVDKNGKKAATFTPSAAVKEKTFSLNAGTYYLEIEAMYSNSDAYRFSYSCRDYIEIEKVVLNYGKTATVQAGKRLTFKLKSVSPANTDSRIAYMTYTDHKGKTIREDFGEGTSGVVSIAFRKVGTYQVKYYDDLDRVVAQTKVSAVPAKYDLYGFSGEGTHNSVTFTLENQDNADYLYIYQKVGKSWKKVKTVTPKKTKKVKISGLKPSTSYQFAVSLVKVANGKKYAGEKSEVIKLKTAPSGKPKISVGSVRYKGPKLCQGYSSYFSQVLNKWIRYKDSSKNYYKLEAFVNMKASTVKGATGYEIYNLNADYVMDYAKSLKNKKQIKVGDRTAKTSAACTKSGLPKTCTIKVRAISEVGKVKCVGPWATKTVKVR